MFRERRKDRRRSYSLRGHVRRLSETGRLRQVAIAAVALAIAGGGTFARCSSSSITGPNESGGSVTKPKVPDAPSSAIVPLEFVLDVPFTYEKQNPCNGEPILVTGHVNIHEKGRLETPNGLRITFHRSDAGKGQAVLTNPLATPTQYVVSEEEDNEILIHDPGGDVTTLEKNVKVISKGSSPNFALYTLMHISYDPESGRFNDPVMQVNERCPQETVTAP
jgi:hypothetical protein